MLGVQMRSRLSTTVIGEESFNRARRAGRKKSTFSRMDRHQLSTWIAPSVHGAALGRVTIPLPPPFLSLRGSQEPAMGSSSAPEGSPKGPCHLCTGVWQSWDISGVHWATKPRPRSLLPILGTWTFSSCAGRSTQLPSCKGLVCRMHFAQGYLCHQRGEDVQLVWKCRTFLLRGLHAHLRRSVTCGSGSQSKKKLMKLTENTDDSALPGCTVRFCSKIRGNWAFKRYKYLFC